MRFVNLTKTWWLFSFTNIDRGRSIYVVFTPELAKKGLLFNTSWCWIFFNNCPKEFTPIVVRYEVFKGRTLPLKLKTKHKISSAPVIKWALCSKSHKSRKLVTHTINFNNWHTARTFRVWFARILSIQHTATDGCRVCTGVRTGSSHLQ